MLPPPPGYPERPRSACFAYRFSGRPYAVHFLMCSNSCFRPSFEPKPSVNPFILVNLPLSHNLTLPLDPLRRNCSWLQALPNSDSACLYGNDPLAIQTSEDQQVRASFGLSKSHKRFQSSVEFHARGSCVHHSIPPIAGTNWYSFRVQASPAPPKSSGTRGECLATIQQVWSSAR